MTIKDYWKDFDSYSSKASDVARHLAFAGIAIVWIFRIGDGGNAKIPDRLLLPLVFLAASLGCDLLHYVAGSLIWFFFCRSKEKTLLKRNKPVSKLVIPEEFRESEALIPSESKGFPQSLQEPIVAPQWLNWPTWSLFITKLILVCAGHVLLIIYMVTVFLKSGKL